jgi:hypothetical protein
MLYSKDVENITGLSRRTANKILNKIKAHYHKGEDDFITITEFCSYYRIDEALVKPFLVD